ncbi:NACHT nucleoside triphosphatase [Penicillium concentricum]|uniref:NACHT nucleoside triphosphatase n=1 Tax=Penicillium concentricum TaxID=293559 RepID=A0A9W9V3P0_9EURO|nr:NACHT nucleoside triphosphatase [Penicillium concentricum]XP_056576802.1 NACHT nucleoside triphosphatase [Penicillium concentricum]KAJ5357097.1 NACHT nucleoside triphosphatase [Penicillium concentricum]KAJ5365335.1 NACHT nucleoside triphosphatase [Penicillium concentricum]
MAGNPPSQPEKSVSAQNKTSSETSPCRKRLRHDAYTIGWVCALPKDYPERIYSTPNQIE